MQKQNVRLPYVDNATAVLITVAINVVVVYIFNWPGGVTYYEALVDSLICAAITTIINLWIIYTGLKKLRFCGQMPTCVPLSLFMQRLPVNPFALGLIYAVAFGFIIACVNGFILWFFDLQNMAFWPWLVYKLIYATWLSIKVAEFCIFRFVQPDWATASAQDRKTQKAPLANPVKNPMPKVGVFKAMFGSVTVNIAMNIIIGSVLGGILLQADGSVLIAPTTVEGMPIVGVIFGFITGILVTNAVVKEMNAGILAARSDVCSDNSPDIWPEISQTASARNRFAKFMGNLGATFLGKLPKGRIGLTCLVCFCAMGFSAAALWGVLTLFDIAVMNFYQFVVFITVYASIISKPLSFVLVKRCMQQDYIRHVLG